MEKLMITHEESALLWFLKKWFYVNVQNLCFYVNKKEKLGTAYFAAAFASFLENLVSVSV